LSCFKCGRIVRSTDAACQRCGMKFGEGTLFECPFCASLVWRSAEKCPTCKTDLIKFAKDIGSSIENFSMDGFVGDILQTELDTIHPEVLRVSCPSCGLMIPGNEGRCPRCDMMLQGSKVDCPVCGEKVVFTEGSCWNCGTPFTDAAHGKKAAKAKAKAAAKPPVEEIHIVAEEPPVEEKSKKKPPKEKKRKMFGRK